MEITKSQNKAVDELIEMVVAIIGKGSREIDTTAAISGTARLAGSFMFRSFGFEVTDVKPGAAMLSEDANVKGPQLVTITQAVLLNFGIQIDTTKMSTGDTKQADSDFVDVIAIIQDPALEIMKRNDLNFEQMAHATAIATAFIIQQSTNISPEEGFGMAIYHYIEGSKTFPPEFSSTSNTTSKSNAPLQQNAKPSSDSKPWWKFW